MLSLCSINNDAFGMWNFVHVLQPAVNSSLHKQHVPLCVLNWHYAVKLLLMQTHHFLLLLHIKCSTCLNHTVAFIVKQPEETVYLTQRLVLLCCSVKMTPHTQQKFCVYLLLNIASY